MSKIRKHEIEDGNLFLETFNTRHIEILDEFDERRDFFKPGYADRLHLTNEDLNQLNADTYEMLYNDLNIKTGLSLNEDETFRHTNLAPVIFPLQIQEHDNSIDILPQIFLKIDLYTSDTAILIANVEAETADQEIIPCNLRVDEYPLAENVAETLFINLSENTSLRILAQDIGAVTIPKSGRDFIESIKRKAVDILSLENGSFRKQVLSKGINPETLINNLKEEEAPEYENTLKVHRKGDDYILSGRFLGSMGELCEKIDQIKTRVRDDFNRSEYVAGYDNGKVQSSIVYHNSQGGYYEIGTSLPEEFAKIDNLDEEEICDMLKLQGLPIAIDQAADSTFKEIAGKPAIFVITYKDDKEKAIEYAFENANIIAQYDFKPFLDFINRSAEKTDEHQEKTITWDEFDYVNN